MSIRKHRSDEMTWLAEQGLRLFEVELSQDDLLARIEALEAAAARPESQESDATAPEVLRNCPCCGQTVPA